MRQLNTNETVWLTSLHGWFQQDSVVTGNLMWGRLVSEIFIQTQCINTITLIGQTYSLQRVPEWGGMGERETHLLASWQRRPEWTRRLRARSKSPFSIQHLQNGNKVIYIRAKTFIKSDVLCTLGKKTEKDVGKTREMRKRKWDREMKAGEGSMVRCSTLKEAELIPDSAVPYTLPQSRWNSSNRQTSNEGGEG